MKLSHIFTLLTAAVLSLTVSCSSEDIPSGVNPEDMVIELDFNNQAQQWPFEESCAVKDVQCAGGKKYFAILK